MGGGHDAADLSLLVVLAAVVADIGWVLTLPGVGVPAMILALVAQVAVVATKWRGAEGVGPYEWALSSWIAGSAVWMGSEYLWDSGLRVGALADRLSGGGRLDAAFQADVLENRGLYPASLGAACLTLWITLVALVLFLMLEELLRRRAGRPRTPRTERHDLVLGMPMHVYCDLWFTPWLLMEACWVLNNLQMVRRTDVRPWLWLGLAGGFTALALCADCVRRYVERRRHDEAVLCSAHLAWVAGNLAWYAFDVTRSDDLAAAQAAPVALFLLALVCLGLSTLMEETPGALGEAAANKAKVALSERRPLLPAP